jgi:hypothetical protein
MLDRTNFTTRIDLKPLELMALCRVRTALESGEIRARRFKMDTQWEENDVHAKCGAVGCIGGWAWFFMQQDRMESPSTFGMSTWMSVGRYHELFYPNDLIMECAKPADGAVAITNFLMGDKHPWAFMNERKDVVRLKKKWADANREA